MNPITYLLNKFTRKRKPYLHEPQRFQEIAYSILCYRCHRVEFVTVKDKKGRGLVVKESLCSKCAK